MTKQTEVGDLYEIVLTAYADLWAQYHALIRAIGMSGSINDGRLAADAQIAMEQEGDQLAEEGRRRLEALISSTKKAGR